MIANTRAAIFSAARRRTTVVLPSSGQEVVVQELTMLESQSVGDVNRPARIFAMAVVLDEEGTRLNPDNPDDIRAINGLMFPDVMAVVRAVERFAGVGEAETAKN